MEKVAQKKQRPKKIAVVFVCTGNTCRSPVAERAFKHFIKKQKKASLFKVSSCGLSAYEGSPMSNLSLEVLKSNKINAANHKARPLTDKLIKATDYFICMTGGHKAAMHGINSVFTVAEITGGVDVVDPYGGTRVEYDKMFEYINYAVAEILSFIENHRSNPK